MKNLQYNLHKIAENTKLLIEVLESKMILNTAQNNNFCSLFNDNQKLMLDTTIEYLKLKNKDKQLNLITVKPYVGDVVKTVRYSLLELRKEFKAKFDKKYIDYINTNNY